MAVSQYSHNDGTPDTAVDPASGNAWQFVHMAGADLPQQSQALSARLNKNS
jgi:hypothetical protein